MVKEKKDQNQQNEANFETQMLKSYKDRILNLEQELDEFLDLLQKDKDSNGKIGQEEKINYN